jgi:hypothetical protein
MGNINTPTHKFCIKCNKTKTVDEFYFRKKALDGRTTYCRTCFKEKYNKEHESSKKREVFDFNSVVIENLPFVDERRSSAIAINLKNLIDKMEVNQSFALPKSYTQNLRRVLKLDFPELKVKIKSTEGSDFIRAYRVI